MKAKDIALVIVLASTLVHMPQATGADSAQSNSLDKVQLDAKYDAVVREFLKKRQAAFPELARYLESVDCDLLCQAAAVYYLGCEAEGVDILSNGSKEVHDLVRNLLFRQLREQKLFSSKSTRFGFVYLAQKGNGRDLTLMKQILAEPVVSNNTYLLNEAGGLPYRILQARAAGTNIVYGLFSDRTYPEYNAISRWSYATNLLAFMPSVANTGPQAAYVYKTYWQAIDLRGGLSSRDTPYSVITNVAPELLTMRVWFDQGSNAVTDVDLSKYRVSVPGLGFATNAPPLTSH